jgi:threonine dehydratase
VQRTGSGDRPTSGPTFPLENSCGDSVPSAGRGFIERGAESRFAGICADVVHKIVTSRVYDVARETPICFAPVLSTRLGCSVYLKREDLQPTFSFKIRGAYNCIAHLPDAARLAGVIAASAGNHAQGVAFAARHLNLRALIVMPETTPSIKVDSVRALGADVVLWGDSYSDAAVHCAALSREKGMTLIHPFDDEYVIAGQGTVAAEIVQQTGARLDTVFVPVGGGGLLAGMASYLKWFVPSVRVVGVEPMDADAMYRSLAANRRVRLEQVGLFADGVAVREVGALTFEVCTRTVDEVVRVSNDEICAAIKDVFDETRGVVEPSGALSVAGLKAYAAHAAPGVAVAILTGANMNFDRLRFVAERSELGESREMLFGVEIPERPGAFQELCAAIGRRELTEFSYRLQSREKASVFVGVRISLREDARRLAARLRQHGYTSFEFTDDEMAKLHVRHMIGGRASHVRDERVCRFQFPERRGALLKFLEALQGRWNISMFHYRNHGSDFGRVLAGFEVPDADLSRFRNFLEQLDYAHVVEQECVAYEMFLR